MKKRIFAIFLFFILVVALPASALTQSEVQALIQQIQQQIAQLQAQLQALIGQQSGGQDWCHTFNSNLGYANSGSAEVAYLHTALDKQGFSYSPDTGTVYSQGTALAVKKFQEKYVYDILTPHGLTKGTGYTGTTTRAKLNQLYGCSQTIKPVEPPKPDPKPVCTPNWQCTSWSTCLNNSQTRNCTDSNSCGVNTGKPASTQNCTSETSECTTDQDCRDEYRSCYYSCSNDECVPLNTFVALNPYPDCSSICTPNWQCSGWSTCSDGIQDRACADYNFCGVNTQKPVTTQSCTSETSGCSDSDGGKDIYTKGSTCSGDYCETDYCIGDNVVAEFYCIANNQGVIGDVTVEVTENVIKDVIGWNYSLCTEGACSDGACPLGNNDCENECISGSTYCTTELYSSTGKLHLKQCGDYDDDPCTEWGTPTLCTGDTTCGYGKCPDTHKPVWSCNTQTGGCDYSCFWDYGREGCCVAKTCSELVCGVHDDGCGSTVDCGSCDTACSSLGKQCGKWNYNGTQILCEDCPSGQYCQNGQCLSSTITTCIDSEEPLKGILQRYIKGSVITPAFLSEPSHDACIFPQNNLVDVFCRNGVLETLETPCSDCKQGICKPSAYEINRAYCKNTTDGGADFIYGDNVYHLDNYCVDNNLVKYSCQNYTFTSLYFKWLKTEIIHCQNGCQNNACIGLTP